MSAANRRRGHDAERMVARWLRTQGWPDACTTRAKLGHDGATAPGDIDFHPLICLETKDVAASAWPTWCRQAVAEAREGMVPAVVRRTRGVPDVGQWECRWPVAEDWTRPLWKHGGRWVAVVDGQMWWIGTMADVAVFVRDVDRETAS